tara:strand:- start:798 stop:1262 length:465 start_codon:yes stop_codon:yes gene_type:complete
MFLLLKDVNINNLILSEKQKNTILPGSDFYRLYYSDDAMTLNGIYIELNIININIQKYFNKVKCIFDESINDETINKILNIEKNILKNFKKYMNKESEYIIEEQLKQGFIKIFTEKNITFGKYKKINLILKISGLWANDEKYGLTFRFLINHQQ